MVLPGKARPQHQVMLFSRGHHNAKHCGCSGAGVRSQHYFHGSPFLSFTAWAFGNKKIIQDLVPKCKVGALQCLSRMQLWQTSLSLGAGWSENTEVTHSMHCTCWRVCAGQITKCSTVLLALNYWCFEENHQIHQFWGGKKIKQSQYNSGNGGVQKDFKGAASWAMRWSSSLWKEGATQAALAVGATCNLSPLKWTSHHHPPSQWPPGCWECPWAWSKCLPCACWVSISGIFGHWTQHVCTRANSSATLPYVIRLMCCLNRVINHFVIKPLCAWQQTDGERKH